MVQKKIFEHLRMFGMYYTIIKYRIWKLKKTETSRLLKLFVKKISPIFDPFFRLLKRNF